MSEQFIDLTLAVRREQNQKRRAPQWLALWLGFKLGCLFTVVVFIIVSLCTR
jgi:hypothetical protein